MSLFTPIGIGQPTQEEQSPSQQQANQQQQFQPQWTPEETRATIQDYDKNPNFYTETQKNKIREHSGYHGIPFYEGEFDLLDAFKQAGAGFFEGFTTLNLMEPADNEYEQIFRNLGHLGGFAPGILSVPLKGLSKALPAMTSLKQLSATAAALNDKSVPMMGAKFLTKKAKEIAKPVLGTVINKRGEATSTAMNFLLGNRARHVMEGAFHLGAASAISSWQGGVDEMMHSFTHGAMAGGVFRGIGQLPLASTESGNKIIRGMAGSLFMGLPATMRGATTPEQVYEYVLGAYFGKGELPWREAKARKFVMTDMPKRAKTDPKLRDSMDPEVHPAFEDLPKEVIPLVKEYALKGIPGTDFIGWGPPELRKLMNSNVGMLNPDKMKEIPIEIDGFEVELASGESGEPRVIMKKGYLDKYKSVIYSGGGEGPDRWFASIGKEKGIRTIHYTFGADLADATYAEGFKRPLNKKELMDANVEVAKASQALGRPMENLSTRQLNYIRRNWYQVKHTSAIYAVAPLEIAGEARHKQVQGGTGWTIEMAKGWKNTRDKIFVFDEPTGKWFKWNKTAGFFQPLKGLPPKPPQSWAGIGSRKSTEVGKKAIQEFMDAKFEKGVKVSPSKEQLKEIAKAELEGERVLKPQVDELKKDIRANKKIKKAKEKELKELDTLNEAEQDIAMQLKNEIKVLDSNISESQNKLDTIIKSGNTSALIDIGTNEIIQPAESITNKVQVEGNGGNNEGVRVKATIPILQFVDGKLKEIWGTAGSRHEENQMKKSLAEQIAAQVFKYSSERVDKYNNRSDDFIKWINKFAKEKGVKDGFALDQESIGTMRQWISYQNHNQSVIQLGTDGQQIMILNPLGSKSGAPYSMSGIPKDIKEPLKVIQELGKEYGFNTGKAPLLAMLDHITIVKDGKKVDLELSRYEDHLFNEYRWQPKTSDNQAREMAASQFRFIKARIYHQMLKDHGMYYFGGRADADRMYFAKLNPHSEKHVDSRLLQKIVALGGMTADYQEMKKRFLKPPNKGGYTIQGAESGYWKKVKDKMAAPLFDRSYASNLVYDMQLNGLKTSSPKEILESAKILLNSKNDFIKTSKAFNKRSQIWLTNGYPGDGLFTINKMAKGVNDLYFEKDTASKDQLSLFGDKGVGKFNYILSNDLPENIRNQAPEWFAKIQRLSTELPEHVDGAIVTRDDVLRINNQDAGMPELNTQNKSFIVSRGETDVAGNSLGALLGKYMMHGAGKKLSQFMQDYVDPNTGVKGLHYIVMGSAAKQIGTRQLGDYRINRKGLVVEDAPMYHLNPQDIYYNYSVKNHKEMTRDQRIPKQLLANLLDNTKAAFPKDVIDDILSSVMGQRYYGTEYGQELFHRFKTSGMENKKKQVDKLIKNWDQLSIEDIIEGIKNPNMEMFADKAFEKLILGQKEALAEDRVAGELNSEQFIIEKAKLDAAERDFNKKIQAANLAILQAKKDGIDLNKTGIFFDRDIRGYRMQVLRSFIMREITKPRLANSMIARMRPYDKGLQMDLDNSNANLKKLNKNEKLFFLDDKYKKSIIKTGYKNIGKNGDIELGELWKLYEQKSPVIKNININSLLRAMVLRVPMDSVSGAHSLVFGGFTGRNGHGVLLHSRTMRALGGADLDADEAFVFFGGEKHGFKKKWQDAFEANRKEFYSPDGKSIADNKEAIIPMEIQKALGIHKNKRINTLRDFLTITGEVKPEEKRLLESRGAMYSINERTRQADAAVKGRNLLGQAAVNPKQLFAVTHSMLSNSKTNEWIEIQRPYWAADAPPGSRPEIRTYELLVKARTAEKWREWARILGRAQVGFASDPMDEIGFKSPDFWFKEMHRAHFNIVKIVDKDNPKRKLDAKEQRSLHYDNIKPYELKKGTYELAKDMNSAFWGKDWATGRHYSMEEIRDISSNVFKLGEAQQHNFMSHVGKRIAGLDWSDSVLRRVDYKQVADLYNKFNDFVKTDAEMKKLLSRSSLTSSFGLMIKRTLRPLRGKEYEGLTLLNTDHLIEIANTNALFKEVMTVNGKWESVNKRGGIHILHEGLLDAARGINVSNSNKIKARIKILSEIAGRAEEYYLQNMGDIATFKVLKLLVEKMKSKGESLDKMADLHKFAELIKSDNWLLNKVRQRTSAFDWNTLSPKRLEMMKTTAQDPDFQRLGLLPPGVQALQQKPSAFADQAKIDAAIMKKKKGLTPNEQRLLDYLLLGSYRRGSLKKIEELESDLIEVDKTKIPSGLKDLLSFLKVEASKTNLSRVGTASTAVDNQSLTNFTRAYLEQLNTSWKPPSEEVLKNSHQKLDKLKEQMKKDNEGNDYLEDEYSPWLEKTTGYEGLKEGVQISDVPAEYRAPVVELINHIKGENNKFKRNINEVIRSIIGKDLNALNLQDYGILNNWFREVKRGTIFQRIFSKGEITELAKRHHWLFPRTINRELMRTEMELMQEEGLYLALGGKVLTGKLMRPTHFVDMAQSWISRTLDSASKVSDEWVNQLKEKLLFVNSFSEGEVLRQIAVRERELGYFTEYIPGELNRRLTIEEQVGKQEYEQRYQDIIKHQKDKLDNTYTIELRGERKMLTGHEVVREINTEYTKYFEKMHKFIVGEKTDEYGINHALEKYRVGWRNQTKQKGAIYKHKEFIRDLLRDWRKGKDLVTDIGIDGLRAMARSMMIEMAGKHKDFQKELRMGDAETTGKIPFKHYFPHMFFNKKIAGQGMKKHWDRLARMDWREFHPTDKIKAEKIRKRKQTSLIFKNRTMTGDWTFQDVEEWEVFDQRLNEFAENKAKTSDKVDWFNNRSRAGSMFSRTGHVPGWSIDASAVEGYSRSLIGTYHRQLAQIFGRHIINKMDVMGDHYVTNAAGRSVLKKGKWGNEQREAWQNFMKLYVQDAMGKPSIIPDMYYNDPKMKLKGTPYAWWADNRVAKRMNNILERFGLTDKELPKELRGMDMQQLRHFSNLEAQFEMAALLAHPKSMVTNIFGGTMHTVESAGWTNWRNSRNIEWLRQNVNSKWKSMEDVMQFVIDSGVYPEYMLYEVGLNKEMQQSRNKEFITDVVKRMKKTPEMKDTTLKEIAKQYGVKDRVVQFAAKFMTVPEKMIRRDAFMSHYLQAWNRWGGAIKDPTHPFLIEQAKKGVRATQFLYSAPFRPAFARTALGKVMTRFQLWSWNAVSFRNDVARQARIYGMKPGTDEYERYARTMQIDLFTFALANMFAYSLFETALPAPWNWMQDTADWIFGNEKERDRAFFGQWPKQLAPLQMVTPPILRLLPTSIRAMIDDDWSKVSKYYVWTMFPFGRIARDVVGPGNLIENPIRVMEKTTGFPLLQLQKAGTSLAAELESGEREMPPTPGGGLSPFGLFNEDE